MRLAFLYFILAIVLSSATTYAQGYEGLIPSNKDTNGNQTSTVGSYAGVLGGNTDTSTTKSSLFADLYASGKTKTMTPDQKKAAEMRAEVQKSRSEKRIAVEKANAERAQREEKERLEKERQKKIKSGNR
jgi:uncharacterized protein YaiL (DUF2058 family)